MLGIDYPGLASYQLSREQIWAERQSNMSRAGGKDRTEAEAMEEEDIWKIYWEAYFDKLKNDMLEDFFVRAIDNPREKRLKEQLEHSGDESLFADKPLESPDDWEDVESWGLEE